MRLREGVAQYIARKRENGCSFERGQTYLEGLYRQLGNVDLDRVKAQEVLCYLDSQVIAISTWRLKYQVLHNFFEFWFSRGVIPELSMPPSKPPERQTFTPYIFTRTELQALLKATSQDRRARLIERMTIRTFILLLYGTGTVVGEALALTTESLDLDAGSIDIRNERPGRSRRIPLGADLRQILEKYLAWRTRKGFRNKSLFVSRDDRPLTHHLVIKSFQRLRGIAKIVRRDGASHQPRLLDLKFTFAVHRITSWIQKNNDLNRMLPALAAYMGQVGLGSTERYLHMTPERFRKDLRKLSPAVSRKHWRDDTSLMEFLASL